ncbi:MAG: efflux RND transporter periplasmic adaptor subunit [Sphaerochaeta sp.]|jgi:multidrug efflux pump subunit AcrA (membrane-fusion protein)|nr:efflux RND transporter periplasmic adaptor subunit [Sphaerochaeta sp.]
MAKQRSKKRIAGLIILIILIILATALVVINPFQYLKSLAPQQVVEESTEQVSVPVRVLEVAQSNLQNTIRTNGSVIDPSSLDVYPEVTGTLRTLTVSVGQRVEKDQVIATIDPSRPGVVYKEVAVKAPASGTVLALPFVVGAGVSMQAPLVRIGMLENLEVVTDIAERHIGSVTIGTKADLTFKAYPNETFPAVVSRLSPVLNPASRTLEVGLVFEDEMRKIKSGMFPTITLYTEHLDSIIAIPRSALLYSGNQAYLYIVDETNTAHRVPVEVGLQVEDMIEIKEGLNVGDLLVTEGQSLLTEGTLVRVLQ